MDKYSYVTLRGLQWHVGPHVMQADCSNPRWAVVISSTLPVQQSPHLR